MGRNGPTPADRPRCGPGRGQPLAGPCCAGTAHSHRVPRSGTAPAVSPPAAPRPESPPSIDDLAWAPRSATCHPRLEGTDRWSPATEVARQELAALARARSLDRGWPQRGSRHRARPCHRQPLGWPVVEHPLASSHDRSVGARARSTAISQPAQGVGWQRSVRVRKDPGDGLCSRGATPSVSSALESLTAVFGMGTGVASPLESPGS